MIVIYNCETCGKQGKRKYAQGKLPKHFFCSIECQNKRQKTREDLRIKNKQLEFRKKVSDGLKNRKKILGDEYHSEETRKKIGEATKKHWENYNVEQKQRLLYVLRENGSRRKQNKPYDCEWNKISKQERNNNFCHMCGKTEQLVVHHIIPVKNKGNRNKENLVVLCNSCHRKLHSQLNTIEKIISDWEIISLLIKERLNIV